MNGNTYGCNGLEILLLATRTRYRWKGYRLLPGLVRRQPERLDQFEASCASCSRPFVVLARVPDDVLAEFMRRRNDEGLVTVSVRESMEQLEVTSCRRCRAEVAAA